MGAWAQTPVTQIALCWRLMRLDGVTIGFTSHDRDVWHDGLRYRAAPGMVPSAISQTTGTTVATMELTGALTSDAITADDMMAGRWDGAKLQLFALDWHQPDAGIIALARGTLGDVRVMDQQFTAELRGPTAVLEQPVVEHTSPECRAALGDDRCRVDLARYRRLCRVVAMDNDAGVVTVDALAEGNYHYGRLRWLSGANSGIESAVMAAADNRLTLRELPPFAVAANALVEIIAGCDKRLATCRDVYHNAAHFRGEPYLPGNDLLTRYPGAN